MRVDHGDTDTGAVMATCRCAGRTGQRTPLVGEKPVQTILAHELDIVSGRQPSQGLGTVDHRHHGVLQRQKIDHLDRSSTQHPWRLRQPIHEQRLAHGNRIRNFTGPIGRRRGLEAGIDVIDLQFDDDSQASTSTERLRSIEVAL